MSPAMKFRRSCNSCNITFFAEDRRAVYCPKCAKKKASTPAPAPPKPIVNKGATAPVNNTYNKYNTNTKPAFSKSAPSFQNKSTDARPFQKKIVRPSKPKIRIARQPKIGVLTDELKDKIIAAYNLYKETSDSIKALHAKISQELWVKPKLVADTITQLRKQEKANLEHCSLSDEDRQKVISLYLKLVDDNIRPTEGRRNFIATQLSLPPREVILAVREWSYEIMGQLTREQLFIIEKEYWRIITSEPHHTFADLPRVISTNLSFVSFHQASRWLDQLHDNTKLKNIAELSEELQKQIIEAYHQYLSKPEPPPQALHSTFAKTFGVKALQVHRTLCDYRCQKKPN